MPQPDTLAPVDPSSRSELGRGPAEPPAAARRPAAPRRRSATADSPEPRRRRPAAEPARFSDRSFGAPHHRRRLLDPRPPARDGVPVRDHAGEPGRGLGARRARRAERNRSPRRPAERVSRGKRDQPPQSVCRPPAASHEAGRDRRRRCFDCSIGAASFIARPTARSTSRPRRSAAAGDSCSARGACRRADAIEAARASVGFDASRHSTAVRRTVRFRRPGIELNLGAIGKGYALDCVAVEMRRAGVTACAPLGRTQQPARHRRPALAVGTSKSSPHARPRKACPGRSRVWLRDAALGTSGAGEQFVVADGTRYGHVIDPRTGWPASGVLSATVVASSAAVADALSTAFLVGGVELAERYCAEHPGVLALVTPDDGSEAPLIFGKSAGASVRRQHERPIFGSPATLQQTLLVVLRTLIGWHFLYEGYTKLLQPAWGRLGAPLAAWSSAAYLKAATGPLAEHVSLARQRVVDWHARPRSSPRCSWPSA